MLTLQTNSEYTFTSLMGENEISIENESIYGVNQTRKDLKIIEFNGLLIKNVDKLVVVGGDTVIFKFYNSLGEIIAEYIMLVKSKLIVKKTSMGSLEYGFVNG